ncbi:uncharacterized protein LOC110983485 [Acanthaster planci]|uniref:Uncharacterized protein LOC110983485 n=1 Tax=Acanthaster planci TaxID=133434 RepID=A0A8B7YYP4_ACAPL|nr:uncharacterized protein LOC110983485 [Acanthaster planci]XP_022098465.1 uncharacterized protein LOC110983485 [Acanthaster planci]XP_022098466.1 uncharacterized protein LOC110983485 [Acanthaster planci]
MAAGGGSVTRVLDEISRDHLECSICHERYQTPKILSCLHSFCEMCLLTYQKALENPSQIPCPKCRQDTKLQSTEVSSLKTNFHLKEIVEDFALKEKLAQKEVTKLLCELCEEQREAHSRCSDCPLLLCKQCKASHQRIPSTASHDVVALDVLRTDTDVLKRKGKVEPPCEKHQGEKKRFFCETCKELICRDCTVVEHRKHEFTTIDDAAPRHRKTVQSLANQLAKQMPLFKKSEADLQKMGSDLQRFTTLAQQQVKEQASEQNKKIEENLSWVLQEIKHRTSLHSTILQENGVTLEKSSFIPLALPTGYQSQAGKEMFLTVDRTLRDLNDIVKKLIETSQKASNLIQQLNEESKRNAADGNVKVAANMERVLSQIQNIFDQKHKNIMQSEKLMTTNTERIGYTLKIANDLVKSGTNADFLNLLSIVDTDIKLLLMQTPVKMPNGVEKIAFQESSDARLGTVVFGASFTPTTVIEPRSTRRTASFGARREPEEVEVTIKNITAFGDEILIGYKEGMIVYNTSGKRLMEPKLHEVFADFSEDTPQSIDKGKRSRAFETPVACEEYYDDYLLSALGEDITCSPSPSSDWEKMSLAAKTTWRTAGDEGSRPRGWPRSDRIAPADVPCESSAPIAQTTAVSSDHWVASLPDGSCFCATQKKDSIWTNLFGPKSDWQGTLQRLPLGPFYRQQIVAIASYGKDRFTISFSGKQMIMLLDFSEGRRIWGQSVTINPDFLASWRDQELLIGSRSPPIVQSLEISEATCINFSISPTVEAAKEKDIKCVGLCSDGSDYIIVVLSVKSAPEEVHVHQYIQDGTFIGCSVLGNVRDVIDAAITGNKVLVLASPDKLMLFQMSW